MFGHQRDVTIPNPTIVETRPGSAGVSPAVCRIRIDTSVPSAVRRIRIECGRDARAPKRRLFQ